MSVVKCAILFKITYLVIVIQRKKIDVSSLSTKSFKPFAISPYSQTFARIFINFSVRTKTDKAAIPPPPIYKIQAIIRRLYEDLLLFIAQEQCKIVLQ